jgi:hypothetical protein
MASIALQYEELNGPNEGLNKLNEGLNGPKEGQNGPHEEPSSKASISAMTRSSSATSTWL